MSLPTMSGTGRLTADVDIRFSPSGVAIAEINLAFNSRKFDKDRQEWIDGDVLFVRGKAFKDLAENAANSLGKGDEVNVTGRLKTERWDDKKTGEKRSATALLIDSIGPNLAYATAPAQRVERGQRHSDGSQVRNGGPVAEDPWGAQPANVSGGQQAMDDEPPF